MRKRTNYFKIFFVTAVFALAIYASVISAQTYGGGKIWIQGKLSDADGKPLDGNFQLKFDFLSAANNVLIKSVGPQAVSVKKGFFTAQIDPTGLSFTIPYLVDVSVEGQKLSPSFILSYAPYALRAVNADSAVSAASAAALSGNLDASKISGQITNTQIQNLDASKLTGSLSVDRISDGSVTGAKIKDGDVSLSDVGFVAGGKKSGQNSYGIQFAIDSQYGRRNAFSLGTTPLVVCSTETAKTFCVAGAITNNGFTAIVYDNNGALTSAPINWIAIGS